MVASRLKAGMSRLEASIAWLMARRMGEAGSSRARSGARLGRAGVAKGAATGMRARSSSMIRPLVPARTWRRSIAALEGGAAGGRRDGAHPIRVGQHVGLDDAAILAAADQERERHLAIDGGPTGPRRDGQAP